MTPSKPNIIFVFSDQQHWRAVGFMDDSFRTPNLDRLAREGTVFGDAFCTTPQCSPSRSSILTGLYPSKTEVIGNVGKAGGNPLRLPTIGKFLRDAGYRTAYFGKWHLGKDVVGVEGWDEDFGVTGDETIDDENTTRLGVDFIERNRDGDRPFALFLSYNDPHDVYHYPRLRESTPAGTVEVAESWRRKDLTSVPSVQRQFMAEDQGKVMTGAETPDWERYRRVYRDKVKLYDDHLGRILDGMGATGVMDDSLIVATSDHGDMDGEHGLVFKGPFMYEQMMRVPLIVRLPKFLRTAATPAKSDFLTVNVDLVSTLADFAAAPISNVDGVSLRPLLTGEGPKPSREFVIGQYYSKQSWVNPIRMIRSRSHKYNLYRVHGEELYDLEKDPKEIHNVAADPAYADVKRRLADELNRWMVDNDDPFATQNPTTREGDELKREE